MQTLGTRRIYELQDRHFKDFGETAVFPQRRREQTEKENENGGAGWLAGCCCYNIGPVKKCLLLVHAFYSLVKQVGGTTHPCTRWSKEQRNFVYVVKVSILHLNHGGTNFFFKKKNFGWTVDRLIFSTQNPIYVLCEDKRWRRGRRGGEDFPQLFLFLVCLVPCCLLAFLCLHPMNVSSFASLTRFHWLN